MTVLFVRTEENGTGDVVLRVIGRCIIPASSGTEAMLLID